MKVGGLDIPINRSLLSGRSCQLVADTAAMPSELYRAVPEALCYMNAKDAAGQGFMDGDMIWMVSRRGKVKARIETRGRNRMPEGTVFVPFFDERVLINKVTLDSTCPISKETDFKKCAVNLYKV